MPIRIEPTVDSRWQMRGGMIATVIGIANQHRHNAADYPVTVVYRDDHGRLETRSLSRFKASAVREIRQ